MCTGGRIFTPLKNNIENPSTHIVIVGYQVEGTLGKRFSKRGEGSKNNGARLSKQCKDFYS